MGPTVGFIATTSPGGYRLRADWPALALKAAGEEVNWRHSLYPPPGRCDVLIVHRPLGGQSTLEAIEAQKAAGTKVIVQEDDNLYALPDNFLEGTVSPEEIEHALEYHSRCIDIADGVILSTPILSHVYPHKCTWVVPNYLPRSVPEREHVSLDTAVRVGWTGWAGTHRHDLLWLRPSFSEALQGGVFTSVGDMRTAIILDWDGPYEPFDFTEHPTEFYFAQSRADIGIVPLDPTQPLNHGKSWLKALEFMCLGKPVVATRLPEQAKLIQHGVSGFLASSPEEFARYVQRLIHDQHLRLEMSHNAKLRAAEFRLEDHLSEWQAPIHALT